MVSEYSNVQDSFWNYVKERLENLNLKFAFKTLLITGSKNILLILARFEFWKFLFKILFNLTVRMFITSLISLT